MFMLRWNPWGNLQVERFPCPDVWLPPPPEPRETFGNMPRELDPIGFELFDLDVSGFLFCFQMDPRFDRQFGIRCCYDVNRTYIPNWPSRLIYGGGPNFIWNSVEERDAEELYYRDRDFTSFETTTTTTANFINFEGIASAVSMNVGKVNISWNRAAINISALNLANAGGNASGNGSANVPSNVSLNLSVAYFVLWVSEENQLVEPLENLSFLQNGSTSGTSGVQVLETRNTSVQLVGLEPNSTQFFLVLAVVSGSVSGVSSNRATLEMAVASVDPVLLPGEINVTQTPDTPQAVLSLASPSLPMISVGDYLSGVSTDGEPFFLHVQALQFPFPQRIVANCRQARLAEVYDQLQLSGLMTAPVEGREGEDGEVALITSDRPLEKPIERDFNFLDESEDLRIAPGLTATVGMSGTLSVLVRKFSFDGGPPSIDVEFAVEWTISAGLAFERSASGDRDREKAFKLKAKPFVQIGPFRLTFIPGLSVFASANWKSQLNVGFTAAATERHTLRIVDSVDRDGFVQFAILYLPKRAPFKFTRTASLTGLNMNVKAVGISENPFLQENDLFNGAHVEELDVFIRFRAFAEGIYRPWGLGEENYRTDQLPTSPVEFVLFKLPKFGVVWDSDQCRPELVVLSQEGFFSFDWLGWEVQRLWLADIEPYGYCTQCNRIEGCEEQVDCIGNNLWMNLKEEYINASTDRNPPKGTLYAFLSPWILPELRILATGDHSANQLGCIANSDGPRGSDPSDSDSEGERTEGETFEEYMERREREREEERLREEERFDDFKRWGNGDFRPLRDIEIYPYSAQKTPEVELVCLDTPRLISFSPCRQYGPRNSGPGPRFACVDEEITFSLLYGRVRNCLEWTRVRPGRLALPQWPKPLTPASVSSSSAGSSGGTFGRSTGWSPPRPPGGGGGDPQCLTYDGFRFECNFLGEVLWTKCENFSVHVVAEPANASRQATVIKAFAVQQDSEIFLAVPELNNTSLFTLSLNGNQNDLNGNFITGTLESSELILETVQGHQVRASLQERAVFLQVTLADRCFEKAEGLLGNMNGDATDDLKPKSNGSDGMLIVSLNSSAEDIYERFWLPAFIADLNVDTCPAGCNAFCCLDFIEAGAEVASAAVAGFQQIEDERQGAVSILANPPLLILPRLVNFSGPSVVPVLQFTVNASSSGTMEDLDCNICGLQLPEVYCNVTGIGESTASLQVIAADLPLGPVLCLALADGLFSLGGARDVGIGVVLSIDLILD
eukprot:Skav204049  [mRNA]  locus=scaffold3:245488:250433:- [translate_table: standard]